MSPLQLAPLSPTYKQLDPPCLYKSVLFSWRKIKLTYNYFECVKLSWNAQLGVVSVRIRVGVGFRLTLTLTLILTLLNLYQTLATLLTRNKLNSKLQANFTGFIILSFIHYWCWFFCGIVNRRPGRHRRRRRRHHVFFIWAPSWENQSSGFATRVDSNRPLQPQKLGRSFKFRI